LIALRAVPVYFWTFSALVAGIVLGGFFPLELASVAAGTTAVVKFIVSLVPILIFAALSPAFATLVKRGLAGKFAASVVSWFVVSSAFAGLIGLIASSLVFRIPFSSGRSGFWSEAVGMFSVFREGSGASLPLIAILLAVVIGAVAVWIQPLYRLLAGIEKTVSKLGSLLGYLMIPILICLGITIGVEFGPKLGMGHFLTITLFTFLLCCCWSLIYCWVLIRVILKRSVKHLLTEYFIPTAVFAAGTISSLVTFPINLANIKKYGVRKEVADFVISFGAVTNMDASALVNIAYGPFILHYVFGLELSWTVMLVAWPTVVLFTIAAPGLPAGMGTALWTSTLFTTMLGIEEPMRSTVITTWVALYGGIPDMFITAANCTGDGLSAILFDTYFDRFLGGKS
jgi:Na+/H+-dicarboxylate symporter